MRSVKGVLDDSIDMRNTATLFILIMASAMFSGCKTNRLTDREAEGYIEVQGHQIWYRIVGADKPGIPLLTLHGGPGGTHFYLEPMEALAEERPVIFYDQLGCGHSDRPGDTTFWTVDYYVEELAAIREALNIRKVHLLGQSWGTMLAIKYLINKKPSGIQSLILAGPCLSARRWVNDQLEWVARLPDSVQQVIRDCEAMEDFANPAYLQAMSTFYNLHVCRTDPWPDCVNRAFAAMGTETYLYMWGPSEFTCNGILKEEDLTDVLPDIRIPVLLTCGEFDEATPETTEYYRSLIPGAKIRVFKDASHMHHVEKSDEFNQVVSSFLIEVDH